jgi:hypothetical protein
MEIKAAQTVKKEWTEEKRPRRAEQIQTDNGGCCPTV